MTFPAPVIHVAIEPKTKGDQDKLGTAIQRLAEEDPTFQVRTDEETGQTIISGMGELHLEVLVDRMRREFKVEANVGKPQVAYRETITKAVEKVDYTHKKQTGGSGQFAKVQIDIEPTRPATARRLRVRRQDHRWSHPARVHPLASTHGCQEAMEYGVLAGYPMVDVKVTLLDGAYHDVDSSELAFKIAGSMAFKEAARKAEPVLLEPMMAVEVITPEDYMGDVIGDLNSRRGQIQAMEERARRPGRQRRWCRCRRCSATSATCAARPRGGPATRMQFDSYAAGAEQRRGGDHREGARRIVPTEHHDHTSSNPKIQHDPTANGVRASPMEDSQWRRRSLSGPSRTSISAPSVTSTMGRRR